MLKVIAHTALFVCLLSTMFCKNPKNDAAQNTVEAKTALTHFTQHFPKAQDVYWDTLETGFVVTFIDGKYDCKAFYDTKSRFQQATSLIELEELPEAINRFLKEKYKKGNLAIVQSVDNGTTKTFHIELTIQTDYVNLNFDTSGKLIKESKTPLSMEELKSQEEEGVENN